MKRLAFAAGMLLVFSIGLLPVTARSSTPVLKNAQFTVGITARLGGGAPWTGVLTLSINPDGIVSGQYRSTSIRPDPFYGKSLFVTGGVTGKNIHFSFGARGRASVQATFHHNNLVGTMFLGSRLYDFVAQRAH